MKCSQRIFSGERADIGGHQCSRNAKVFVDGKGFCNLHSPEGKADRQRKWREKFDADLKASKEKYEKQAYDRRAGDWCRSKGMTLEQLENGGESCS